MQTLDISKLDRFRLVAHTCEPVFHIYGNPRNAECSLIDVADIHDGDPLQDPNILALQERGLSWIGCAGLSKATGSPRIALTDTLNPETISALAEAVVSVLVSRIHTALDTAADPELVWLREMLGLPDDRPTN